MQKAIILTEEEYSDLLKVQSAPDELLRETNTALKKKLDESEAKLNKGSFDRVSIDTPFIVTNDKLCLRTATDFIVMYNNISSGSLKHSDDFMFNQLTNLAGLFNLSCQYPDAKAIKAYRVSLQKKKLCTPTKIDGRVNLKTGDK